LQPRFFLLFSLLAALCVACNWHLHTRGEPKAEASKAPDFALPDADGNTVSLDNLLAQGPAVLVFYRGYW